MHHECTDGRGVVVVMPERASLDVIKEYLSLHELEGQEEDVDSLIIGDDTGCYLDILQALSGCGSDSFCENRPSIPTVKQGRIKGYAWSHTIRLVPPTNPAADA